MAEEISLEILIEADKADLTLGQLKKGFTALEEELENTKRGTKRFNELTTAMAQTNREVKNMELSFEALDNEQVASEIGSVAGGIGDVTASLVLLGGENETMQQMAASIEKAMAISMGFKGAIEGVSSASKLYNNLLKTGRIQTILFGDATKKMTIFQKALNLAMKANPIMLIVAGVTALAGAYVLLTSKVDTATEVQNAYNEASAEAEKAVVKEKVSLDKLVHTAKNENLSKSQRLEAMNKLNELSPEYLGNITLETINTEAGTAALDAYVDSLNRKAKAQAMETMLVEEHKKLLDLERAEREGDLGFINSLTQFTTAGGAAQKVANAENAEAIRLQKEKIAGLTELMSAEEEQAENHNLFNMAMKSSTFDREGLEKTVEDNRKKRAEDAKTRRAGSAAEIEKFDTKRAESIETEIVGMEMVAMVTVQTEEQKMEAKRLALKEEKDIAQAKDELRQAEIDKIQKGLDVLSNANELFNSEEVNRIKAKEQAGEKLSAKERARLEKDGKIKKKLAIAQLAVDTARSISSGIAAAAGIPFPGNLIAFLPTIAAILGNMASARALLGGGGGGGASASSLSSAAGGSAGATAGVPINPVSNTSTILGDQQVYVTETDITATQNKVGVIEASATF